MSFQAICENLRTSCQALLEAGSPAEADVAVDECLRIFVQAARNDPSCRRRLAEAATFDFVDNPRVGSLFTHAGQAIAAWYRAEFAGAATRFLALHDRAIELDGRHALSPALECIAVQALVFAAACHTRQGTSDAIQQGRQLLERAAARIGESKLAACRGWLRFEQGRLAFWDDDPQLAERCFNQADRHFDETGNRFGRARVAGGRARLFTHQGQYGAALEELAWLRAWLDSGDHLSRAQALYRSGRIWRYRENYTRAVEVLEQARQLVQDVDNPRWEAHIRDVLGDVYLLSGRLDDAEREYRQPVFSETRDPLVSARSGYREAKLEFARLKRLPAESAPEHRWGNLKEACLQLASGRSRQMIPEKALLVLGRIQEHRGDIQQAVQSYAQAERGFRGAAARWYQVEAMYRQGCALVAAGRLPEAAPVLWTGLRLATDPLHRQRFTDAVAAVMGSLSAGEVCAYISRLQEQVARLTGLHLAEQRATDGLRSVLVKLHRRLAGLPNLPVHFHKYFRMIEFLTKLEDVQPNAPEWAALKQESQAFSFSQPFHELAESAKARREEIGEILQLGIDESQLAMALASEQGRLLSNIGTPFSRFRLVPVAELAEPLQSPTTSIENWESLVRPPVFGVVGDAQVLGESLSRLREFMQKWAPPADCDIRLDRAECRLVVLFHGSRPTVKEEVLLDFFQRDPAPGNLKACGMGPQQWARLLAATLSLQASAGRVCFRVLSESGNGGVAGSDRGESPAAADGPCLRYGLEVVLPAEAIPEWSESYRSQQETDQ